MKWLKKLLTWVFQVKPKEEKEPLDYVRRSLLQGKSLDKALYGWITHMAYHMSVYATNNEEGFLRIRFRFPGLTGRPILIRMPERSDWSTPGARRFMYRDLLEMLQNEIQEHLSAVSREHEWLQHAIREYNDQHPGLDIFWKVGIAMFPRKKFEARIMPRLGKLIKQLFGTYAVCYKIKRMCGSCDQSSLWAYRFAQETGYPEWPHQWVVVNSLFRWGVRFVPPGTGAEPTNIYGLATAGDAEPTNIYGLANAGNGDLEEATRSFLKMARARLGKANWKYLCKIKKMRSEIMGAYYSKTMIRALRLIDPKPKHLTGRTLTLVSHWDLASQYCVPMMRKMIKWVHAGQTAREKERRLMECQTLWDYFVNEVLDGVRNLGEPTPETIRTMRQWSRASLTNVLEASRTWHNTANERYQNKRLAEAAKNAVRAEQEGLYQPQHRNYEVGKVKFEFLSFKELPAEGKMMHHCVGSYIHDAAARRTFIFHGNLDGEQATIEISVDLRVRQLFGPCNQECSDSMKQAARNLCAVLEKEHRNHEG